MNGYDWFDPMVQNTLVDGIVIVLTAATVPHGGCFSKLAAMVDLHYL